MPDRIRVVLVVLFAAVLLMFSRAAVAQTAGADQDERKQALALAHEMKFQQAIPMLQRLADKNPSDGEVIKYLGYMILVRANTIQDPEQMKKERLSARAYLLRAHELGVVDNISNLAYSIPLDGSKAPFSNRSDVDVLISQGETAFREQDYDKAFDFYQQALALDPKSYHAALFSADVRFAQKRYDEAGELFARAVQVDPDQESAYRYWADALFNSGKKDQAREKYIEAVVADPYDRQAWFGVNNWAKNVGVKLTMPQIKSPNSFQQKDGKTNITLDPSTLKKKDGTSAWMLYDITRAQWQKEEFTKQFPSEKAYRHTLKEEVAALGVVITLVREQQKSHEIDKLDPALATLLRLGDAGLLEPYILLARADEGIAQDYAAYRDAHRDKVRQFLDECVVPKLPQ